MNNFTKRAVFLLYAICICPVLSSCESAKKIVSGKKQAPDEFVIYSQPPLSLPPNFKLRPPAPGTSAGLAITPGMEAKAALSGKKNKANDIAKVKSTNTPGTFAILKKTGALTSDPSIRDVVNQETTILSREDKRFVDRLIFWVNDKPFEGTVVDAGKESQRIQTNNALGKTIDDGDTPKIKRKRASKGLLEF